MRINVCNEGPIGMDVRQLVPVHADFNLDLSRLGADGMRSLIARQLASSDRARFPGPAIEAANDLLRP